MDADNNTRSKELTPTDRHTHCPPEIIGLRVSLGDRNGLAAAFQDDDLVIVDGVRAARIFIKALRDSKCERHQDFREFQKMRDTLLDELMNDLEAADGGFDI